ncbi:MAG: hypothetical protein M0P73_10045 [Syntrophobacterales bacterium]|jgi:hypothetical protein|nr:hypothetical protein [Syntrophobacterales bacterium]
MIEKLNISDHNIYLATVVKIIDSRKLVINRGERDGIKYGQRFIIYHVEEEPIIDPITNESLGHLEIVKGTGKVFHIQERISIIESDMHKTNLIGFPIDYLSFDNPEIGDKAKPI